MNGTDALRLLFIVENYPPHYGGVEVVFKNTCEGLAEKGHAVTLITHKLKGTKRHEVVNGVHIHRVPCFHSRYIFTFLAPFFALKHARAADLIHTTTFNAAPVAWLVGKLTRKKVICTVHEIWLGRWKEYTNKRILSLWLHEFLEWCVFRLRYDKYVCVSESTARNLRDSLPNTLHKRIVVNHNGFDYEHWERKKYVKKAKELRATLELQGKFVVLGYGRPGFSKGFEYLVRAIPDVLKKVKNAHFVLIISRDKQYAKEFDNLVSLIKAEKVHDVATIVPPQGYASLPAYVAMADCVVVPSLAEGFGYTTVESNAIGTPVVASNTTSIPEVISGKHVLVKTRDAKSIAAGISKVKSKQYRTTKLKKFLWKDNIFRTLKTYKELMS